MMSQDELRQMANHFRLIALDGEDIHLKVLLRKLADEFDAEAAAVAKQEQKTSKG